MSTKPYIVQQDSPNLVIVPTGTYYEPPAKKVKQDSVQNLPTPTKNYDNSVFTNKTAANLYFSGRSINNDVLIDVTKVKRPPASWASNFLQSIGGSSPKFNRSYSAAPKLTLHRKENTQPKSSDEITVPNSINSNNQINTITNSVEIQPMMEKEKSVPKINLNLNKHKYKPSHQSTTTKGNSQPDSNTKSYQSKSDVLTKTVQAQVCKEPSLPKGYKIPIQSKYNKNVSQSVVDIKTSQSNSIKQTNPVNNYASQGETIKPKFYKPKIQDVITSRESTQSKRNKDTNNLNKPEMNQERDSVKSKTYSNEFKHAKEIDYFKTKKTTTQLSNKIHTSKPNTDKDIVQSKTNEGTAHLKTNEVKNHDKEIKPRKTTKETDLPRSYKDPCPLKYHKEITSHKSNKENAQSKNIKDKYKGKNRKETTYSTKLKTKKCNEINKTTKHSKSKHTRESHPKKHKTQTETTETIIQSNSVKLGNAAININPLKTPQALLKKEDKISKIKKKTASEKNTKEKKMYMEDETNIIKKRKTKHMNDERSSHSISPIKSVVTKIKSDHNIHNKEKRYHKESNVHSHVDKTSESHNYNSKKEIHRDSDMDLRTKLKRKIDTNNYRKEDYKWDHSNKKNKFATVPNGDRFVPDENLIISFNAKDDTEKFAEKMSPKKKLARKKTSGGKKCKKIKLEINIVFDHAGTTDEESINSEDEANVEAIENADFSFLDDFNVDEIVKTLNECNDSSNKNDNNEVEMTVNDVKAEVVQSSDRTKVQTETAANCQFSTLIKKNETEPQTAPCNNISSAENKTKYHQEALQLKVNPNRHLEIIGSKLEADIGPGKKAEVAGDMGCLATMDNITVKKEVDVQQSKTVEENAELHQNENSQTVKGQVESSKTIVLETSSEQVMHSVKKEVDINQNTEIKGTTELPRIEHSQDIKVRIASTEIPVEKSTSEKIKNPILLDTSQDNKKNDDLNKPTIASLNYNTEIVMKNDLNNDSKIISKIDIAHITPGVTQTETTMSTVHNMSEPDVIIVDDSDDEKETEIKNNQSIKDNCAIALKQASAETPTDKEIILNATIENSEPILILDTDKKSPDSTNDQNTNSKKNTLAENNENIEVKIVTEDTTKRGKTLLEDTSIENKIKRSVVTNSRIEKLSDDNETNNDIHSEIIKTERGNSGNDDLSNAAKIDDKIDAQTFGELSNMKPAEEATVVPENEKTKAVPAHTKTQNVNTKIEIKAPNKENSPTNSEDKDKVATVAIDSDAKPKVRSQVNDIFVRKLETKLGSMMGQKYTITDLMRVGQFSKLYSCKESECNFAVKVLKNISDGYYLGLQKQNMMIKLQNGVPENNLNCVRLIRGFSLCGLWCFLMEYYPRNLEEALRENKRSFHIDVVQNLSRQLVSAVTILRNNNIIHSDIKPSHILINASNTRIKLCGFDQSSYFDGGKMLPNTGTVNYRAPELILGYPAGYGIDVWSTALVMYEMATNRKLFPGIYNNDILYKQLCTIGSVPLEMLVHSAFRYKHFRGTAFSRVIGPGGQSVIMHNIRGNDILNNVLFQTYAKEWSKIRNVNLRAEDKSKLCAFSKLLHNMLVMFPKNRIAIEFVFANPFIYESFDNC